MAGFLIRSFSDPKGYTELNPLDGLLPRSGQESYVPWAVTLGTDEVVYARTGEHTGFRGGGDGKGAALRPYDHAVSQKRRQLVESLIGMMALNQPHYSRDAVEAVSSGVKRFLVRNWAKDPTGFQKKVFKEIGHYFFTDRGGFGRLSDRPAGPGDVQTVWLAILDALGSGTVDQKLSIHDAVGRKILPLCPRGSEIAEYERLGPVVRQDWFDDAARRGRANASVRAKPTTQGGTAPHGVVLSGTSKARVRGVDSFVRDMTRTRDPLADSYYDDVDERNLLFGAGISGTTGTLLQAAAAFGGITTGERLKQYVLAIVGYLVGGGMHSLHESLAVAVKAGLPYQPGTFVYSLPLSLTGSMAFRDLATNYYDIVVLGGTHWRYNQTHLPSHLNNMLRPSS
jgi:hypothetical protein